MRIGRVIRTKVERGGKTHSELIMDIRTISFRKKLYIDINKHKYVDGDMSKIKDGCEGYPDYLIMLDVNAKGEPYPYEHVGNIENVKKDGKEYKVGFIVDPFLNKEPIYFSMFPVEKEDIDGHIFNIEPHISVPKQ